MPARLQRLTAADDDEVDVDAEEIDSVQWCQVELQCLVVSATCSSKHRHQKKVKNVDLYSASSCSRRPAVKPAVRRSSYL